MYMSTLISVRTVYILQTREACCVEESANENCIAIGGARTVNRQICATRAYFNRPSNRASLFLTGVNFYKYFKMRRHKAHSVQ